LNASHDDSTPTPDPERITPPLRVKRKKNNFLGHTRVETSVQFLNMGKRGMLGFISWGKDEPQTPESVKS